MHLADPIDADASTSILKLWQRVRSKLTAIRGKQESGASYKSGAMTFFLRAVLNTFLAGFRIAFHERVASVVLGGDKYLECAGFEVATFLPNIKSADTLFSIRIIAITCTGNAWHDDTPRAIHSHDLKRIEDDDRHTRLVVSNLASVRRFDATRLPIRVKAFRPPSPVGFVIRASDICSAGTSNRGQEKKGN